MSEGRRPFTPEQEAALREMVRAEILARELEEEEAWNAKEERWQAHGAANPMPAAEAPIEIWDAWFEAYLDWLRVEEPVTYEEVLAERAAALGKTPANAPSSPPAAAAQGAPDGA